MRRLVLATAFAGVVFAGVAGELQAAPIAPLPIVDSDRTALVTPVRWDGARDFGQYQGLGGGEHRRLGGLLARAGGLRALFARFGGGHGFGGFEQGRAFAGRRLAGRGYGGHELAHGLAGGHLRRHGFGGFTMNRLAGFGRGGGLGGFGGQGGFDIGQLMNMVGGF